jgi:hypothetical protein
MAAMNIRRQILFLCCAAAALAAPGPLQAPATHLLVSRAELQLWEQNAAVLLEIHLRADETAWAAYFAGRRDVYRELGAILDRTP